MRWRGLILFLCLMTSHARAAVNGLTVGALTLVSTFECVGVEAAYSGDDNANSTVAVEYKISYAANWVTTYPPFIDRRMTIAGFDTQTNSAHSNKCRVSIVGLVPGNSYDVRVTWSDADGVTGSNPVTGSVSTRATFPTLGGTTIYVDSAAGGGGDGSSGSPYNTVAAAISAAVAGDTIKMKGSFGATSITKSGTTTAWIKIEQWNASLTLGGASGPSLTVIGSNLWFHGFTISGATGSTTTDNGTSIKVDASSSWLLFDRLSVPDVAPNATDSSYGASGIHIIAGAAFITSRSNSFTCSIAAGGGPGGVGNVAGAVYFDGNGNATGGHILTDNTVSGTFRDGFGGEANYWGDGPVANSDICRNTLSGMQDDGIECEGDNCNVRLWGNAVTNTAGQSGLGIAGTSIGPFYVFRNIIYTTNNIIAVKLGNSSPGPVLFCHNTIVSRNGAANGADGLSDQGGDPKSNLIEYYNNIFETSAGRYCIYRGGRTNTYDYNQYHINGSAAIADEYNGSGTYTTLASFQSGTSQEAHGNSGDPLFASGTFEIGTSSPAKDDGVSLANFNSRDGSFGYNGSSPDMGHFEFGGFVTNAWSLTAVPNYPKLRGLRLTR